MKTRRLIRYRLHLLYGLLYGLLTALLLPPAAADAREILSGVETNVVFGAPTDTPVPGDYNGDGRGEVVLIRERQRSDGTMVSTWYRHTDAGAERICGGPATGIPAQADFDGDGAIDPALYLPADRLWYVYHSSSNAWHRMAFGYRNDAVPVPGDYDGDGLAVPGVYASFAVNSYWGLAEQFLGDTIWGWGLDDDLAVPGDYDGDGIKDITVYRPSNARWYAILSADASTSSFRFGALNADPLVADYDGDGITDPASIRNGTWRILRSALGSATFDCADWETVDYYVAFDYDGDGIADPAWLSGDPMQWTILLSGDRDDDNDELTNSEEAANGTSPVLADTDGDGMPDGWEVEYGLDPLADDASADSDGDGVSNLTEYLQGRDPTKGAVPDSEGAIGLVVFTNLD